MEKIVDINFVCPAICTEIQISIIKSDWMQMNETQDHHKAHMDGHKPKEGGTEVVVQEPDPVVRR